MQNGVSLHFEAPKGCFAMCLDICHLYIWRSGDARQLNSLGRRGDDRSITLFGLPDVRLSSDLCPQQSVPP